MNILNYQVVLHIDNTFIGYGTNVHDLFEILQASHKDLLSKSIHLAFNAPDIEDVNNFHKAAINQGMKSNGAPVY